MNAPPDFRAEITPVPPEPPKKPSGHKQQVGRITVELNGQTKTLNVYWKGEDVSSYDKRTEKNIQAIKKFAKALFEQMQKNPDIRSPIQTEVEVEYQKQNWQKNTSFKLLSAKYVPKENAPAEKALPSIPKPDKGTEATEPAKMPTFIVVENLAREILRESGKFTFKRAETGAGIKIKEKEGKPSLKGAATPLTPKEEEKEAQKVEDAARRLSMDVAITETTKRPSAKKIMTEDAIKTIIQKYKRKYRQYLRTLLTKVPIPSEVQSSIEGLTYHIEKNRKVDELKMSRFRELWPTNTESLIESLLKITKEKNFPASELTTAIDELQTFFNTSRAADQIFKSLEQYQAFVDKLADKLNALEEKIPSGLSDKHQKQIAILRERIATAKSNFYASVTRYTLFEKNWQKLLREHLVPMIWDILAENEELSIEEALNPPKITDKEGKEIDTGPIKDFTRVLGFYPHLEDISNKSS